MANPIPFTEEEFLMLGFDAQGDTTWRRSSRSTQEKNFRSLYGTSARAVASIWVDLQQLDDPIAPSTKPIMILVAYRWLKSYLSEPELKSEFSMPVKSIRETCRYMTTKIASLRGVKIDPFWLDHGGFQLGRSVDGIHYPITEPRPFSKRFSSHKLGGNAGLMYEYVLDTWRDRIVWLNGPFPAGQGDRSVFKDEGLRKAVEDLQAGLENDSIRIIADDGYKVIALLHVLSHRNEFDPRDIGSPRYFKEEEKSGLSKRPSVSLCYS